MNSWLEIRPENEFPGLPDGWVSGAVLSTRAVRTPARRRRDPLQA